MKRTATVLAAAVLLGVGSMAQALEVGDPAPALHVAKWANNTPVTVAGAKGKVLVVEFWATWCGPCRTTIPHLNKLHAKYGDKDLVLVGVSAEDEDTVKGFMKSMPMDYHVALDDARKTSAAYMQAVGARGIPHAFVIDKAGKLAWHGHPLAGMDGVIKKLMAGTFDPEKQRKLAKFQDQLKKAKSYEDAYAALDGAIKAVPDDPEAYRRKHELLTRQGKAEQAAAVFAAMLENCAGDPEVLAQGAIELATTGDLTRRNLAKALELATKAAALTKNGDTDILETLARVHYEMGHLKLAVETLETAVGAATGDAAKELQALRDYYAQELERRRQDPAAKL